jgi:hypothetical protein
MLSPGRVGTLQWTRRDGEIVALICMRAAADHVILTHRYGSDAGEHKYQQYRVLIERTPCNIGGTRPWFICPAQGCARRVAILYEGRIFACRHCYQLPYASTREDSGDRARRRADRLRERLGWRPGVLNGGGPKPTPMHWQTFERLTEEHDKLLEICIRALTLKADRMRRRLMRRRLR